ncbi:MAG: hypothetical protein R2710_04305 [Acidimicrobiales bacterium]
MTGPVAPGNTTTLDVAFTVSPATPGGNTLAASITSASTTDPIAANIGERHPDRHRCDGRPRVSATPSLIPDRPEPPRSR